MPIESRWQDQLLSIILPLPQNVEGVEAYIEEVNKVLTQNFPSFEVVLIDRFSQRLNNERLKVFEELVGRFPGFRYQSIFGDKSLEASIMAGIDQVIGDFCLVALPFMDPPRLFPQMVEYCRAQRAIVLGQRLRTADSRFMRFAKNVFYRIMQWTSGIELLRDTSYFIAFNRQHLVYLQKSRDRFRLLKVLTAQLGVNTCAFVYEPTIDDRAEMQQRGYFRLLNIAFDILFSDSSRILRWLSLLSLSASFFLWAISVLQFTSGTNLANIHPWMGLLFFINFFALESLNRLVAESKDRPLYYNNEDISQDVKVYRSKDRNVSSP